MAGSWIFRMKIFAIIFASLLPVAAIAQPAPHQAPDRTWITNVTIISPEKIDHIETGSVLIENGRILRVERRKGAKKPAGASIVSGEGQFLIPGLIDSHVHLASIPGMRPEVNLAPAKASRTSFDVGRLPTGLLTLEISFQYKRNPDLCQRTTVSGVTTRRDCCHPDQSRRTATQKSLSSRSDLGRGCRRFSTASC
jgi:cytosine/adenosine deaminase-related metal-dependent hydrolase